MGGLCYCDIEQLQPKNLVTRSIFRLPKSFTFCFLPSHLSVPRRFACLPLFSSSSAVVLHSLPSPNLAPCSGNVCIDPLSGSGVEVRVRRERSGTNQRHAADKYSPVSGLVQGRRCAYVGNLITSHLSVFAILISGGLTAWARH